MPHPRSFEYIEALAKIRGVESGFLKAEAFRMIRSSRELGTVNRENKR